MLLVVVMVVGLAATYALGTVSLWSLGSLFGTRSDDRNSQVVQSVEREEEVVLLSLAVQGIDKDTEARKLPFGDLWESGRASYIQYEFRAKLGIDGEDVDIEPKPEAENTYIVSIPEFIWIGESEWSTEVAVENNGALSLFTPEIDQVEQINEILQNAGIKEKHLKANDEQLRGQARAFYTGILTAIDPEVALQFEFTE